MKNILLIGWWLFVAQQVSAQTSSGDEEAAIKAVVIRESDANAQRDFQAWIDCYVDSPQTSYANTSSPGTVVYRKNFDEVKQATRKSMEASLKPWFTLDNQDEWNIKVGADMAWARRTQYFTILATNTKLTAIDLKVLEKINGQWKISTAAWMGDYKNASPPMKSTY